MQKGELTMAEYIEREKVIGILNNNIGNSAIRSAVNGYPEEYFDGWTDAASEAITEVEGIPAADVRPERYGEWLISGECYECSECGGGSNVNTNPYCWKCGAKMDGKDVTQ
ncbi:hypothetical protein [Bacteroides congonensis]|uniref:hypothetical protein n=1 Tax=Bacteroides congonensis TaxID=1871006 RepID=UPI00265E8879|nr:hypothetical protein [Bacteroides congonensis]